ncbi:MAG: DNA/RNA non-specific endonuclease [Opitutaceae bacterium]|nr:DNA/RNA non-specific endonuclease [Opitutaceae bacterium]
MRRRYALENTGYVVGYSDALNAPVWVAYRMWGPGAPAGGVAAPRLLRRRSAHGGAVRPDEYTGSGYDRGHMAPNYAIGTHFGAAAQLETFLMSNVIPQKHSSMPGCGRSSNGAPPRATR